MTPQSPSPSHSVPFAGRWTGVGISFIVILCIGLIGLSGYIKYELDHNESLLSSQDVQLTPELQGFDKIRRELGYGGFLGAAQNFVTTHDQAVLPDMRSFLKQAEDSFEHLPDKTRADTRHDLRSIIDMFNAAEQKAEKSTASGGQVALEFTPSDLAPLYASLPILDARVATAIASNKTDVESQIQLWATALTLISWVSLIIASSLAAGILLVLRGRNSAPMRALAQSVKNMARGDMRTSIWGMERRDAIGELARSVDQARFHFSQLPDMSLLSEQGPVRIRFEGNTRSLFEAMMRVISRDSEQVHAQATTLTEAILKQQEALAHVVERVEAVLQNVEKRAISGDHQVRAALQGMLGSAESLKNAQEHAADQLNRIIPYLQERTQGIGEIAQITGKQVSQALQSLAQSERGLKSSAELSDAAIRKFSTTADTLGERMFGAINLLQASGKVLAETTEGAQSRFSALFDRFNNTPSQDAAPQPDKRVADRLEVSVATLVASHNRLERLLNEQTQTARAHIDLLTTQSGGLLTQTATASQTLSTAADRLRDEQAKLAQLISEFSGKPAAEPQQLPDANSEILANMRDGFAALEQRVSILHNQLTTYLSQTSEQKEKPADFTEQMRDHWYQMAAQIEATRSNLAQVITQQTDRVEAHLSNLASNPVPTSVDHDFARDAQSQMEQQTLILNELVATLGLLDAHMQEIRSQVSGTRQRAG